ncbi:hypothetical protein N7532_007059 [Penicillium argentinense]|uniref:Xylanolytic transcriptional activator regulatory domain-containing protein n=1 Tax=Penicillium argentinense TaxID=1131581 RepID=A0A9W9FH05_9EURO|nr:uncharacterized protein N7532_007059 [Penicillium argentinense]KAJ5100058.1 hypothetical protein N7532_007059 [Penicillium argentinense]
MRVGEMEQRKRLWWWVYVFDSMASLLHGLPSLINDVDVDNDMPMDCHLHDLDMEELSYPLPGERTAVFVFIQYVLLGEILSSTRGMNALHHYATTKWRKRRYVNLILTSACGIRISNRTAFILKLAPSRHILFLQNMHKIPGEPCYGSKC